MLGRAWTHTLEACTDESPPFPVLCTWVGLGWSVLILWSWASDSMSSKGCNEDGMRFCIRRTSVKPGTWWSSPSSLLPPPPASSPSYHHHQHPLEGESQRKTRKEKLSKGGQSVSIRTLGTLSSAWVSAWHWTPSGHLFTGPFMCPFNRFFIMDLTCNCSSQQVHKKFLNRIIRMLHVMTDFGQVTLSLHLNLLINEMSTIAVLTS